MVSDKDEVSTLGMVTPFHGIAYFTKPGSLLLVSQPPSFWEMSRCFYFSAKKEYAQQIASASKMEYIIVPGKQATERLALWLVY